MAALVERWLASDQVDEKLLGKAVTAVLEQGDAGLGWLGGRLGADAEPAGPRSKGLQALASHVCLGFLKRQRDSEVVFAGQYAPLRRLEPFASRLFSKLLLDPPDWYPSTHRKHVVPVLRDLLVEPPAADLLAAMETIADSADREPEDLRRALAYALHQWGRERHARAELDRWRRASAEGGAENRVLALRNLIEVHYQLRDYRAAAAAYASMEALASHSELDLWPSDHYTAACCYALIGERERAFVALEKCAALQGSGGADPSLWIARKTWETDPEIGLLRGGERFDRALRRAFPGSGPRDGPGRGR